VTPHTAFLFGALLGLLAVAVIALLESVSPAPEGQPMEKNNAQQQQQDENPTPPSPGPARPWLDLNKNWIADWKEPWFLTQAFDAAIWAVLTFAKPHTVAYKVATAAKEYRDECRRAAGLSE
jgi:hypothetical protein